MTKKISFNLNNKDYIALCDLLKITSVANSGGEAKQMITQSLVLRGNEIETRKTAKIKAGEVIYCNGVSIEVI
ncbi:MAG: RNA-binding S4 domain-containing protein [Neisseriaceae bacterium]|nr:RNA-binding S4 domain-containing protein [Neisseriaceae bacterium]